MQPQTIQSVLTVSGVLFGFLFAGFWWSLNRELTFASDQRHFKFGYLLLLVSMVLVAVYGIVIPLWHLARLDKAALLSYRGVLLALVAIVGYMLTELGHYSVFQKPKYTTVWERIWFALTILALLAGLYMSLRNLPLLSAQ